jgi:hypothetical protein
MSECDMTRVREAARLVGVQLEAERQARIAARDAVGRCTYLGCYRVRVVEIRPPWGPSWFGCETHYANMGKALQIGCASAVTSHQLAPAADGSGLAAYRAARAGVR